MFREINYRLDYKLYDTDATNVFLNTRIFFMFRHSLETLSPPTRVNQSIQPITILSMFHSRHKTLLFDKSFFSWAMTAFCGFLGTFSWIFHAFRFLLSCFLLILSLTRAGRYPLAFSEL